ncbi:hypothetical protein PULV_b0262 [Pseudoalteromonas ulvae UL12]|nr:hypothetical protein [Pseudoalteromonas ulvae UL12]
MSRQNLFVILQSMISKQQLSQSITNFDTDFVFIFNTNYLNSMRY